jgi:hypothetical protein
MKREVEELHRATVTPRYNSTGGGSGPGRSTEQTALRELDPARQRQFNAVSKAIRATARSRDGAGHWRNEIIRLVYFRQSHNLHGAAQKCFVSFRTAQRWQRDFFDIVEKELGLK